MELRESFRAPFLQMAWQRHTRVVELLARPEASELRSAAAELHCLSGEASMLDFQSVAELARTGEQAARDGDRPLLLKVVGDLHTAIKAVETPGSS